MFADFKSLSHLTTFSHYSLAKGFITYQELAKNCRQRNIHAIASTNCSSMYGVLEFQKSMHEVGVNPIVGSEIIIGDHKGKTYTCSIIAKNFAGYKSLCNLLSFGYQCRHKEMNMPVFYRDDLKRLENVFCIAGFLDGELGHSILNTPEQSKNIIEKYVEIFGPDNYVIDIARIGRQSEEVYIDESVLLGRQFGVPLILTNYVCFLNANDVFAHKVKVAIHGHELGTNKCYAASVHQYLKSYDEMSEVTTQSRTLIDNANYIASQCHVDILGTQDTSIHFPFHPEWKNKDLTGEITERSIEFLRKNSLENDTYLARLRREIEILESKSFITYIYAIYDIINWAKSNDIPVGPGRGSGAGSLLAFCLGITTIDPIKYGLLFERFLNIERNTIPDFDIDFCMNRREEVINYLYEKYGQERVAYIATCLTFKTRSAIRETARSLGLKSVHKLLPHIPEYSPQENLSVDLLYSKQGVASLVKSDIVIKFLLTLAQKIEHRVRGYGKHAAGIVITPEPLVDYMNVYFKDDNNIAHTNFDKNCLESLGLIKVDILGLSTLTTLDNIVKEIRTLGEPNFSLEHIPMDDEPTFALISSGRTCGIFQLESFNMKNFCRDFRPTCFSDVAALISIYRPGPLSSNMHKDIAQRKKGTDLEYPHEVLRDILEETYGIITYQEQIMSIFSIIGGLTLGVGDKVQRAIGKKDKKAVEQYLNDFRSGATKLGYQTDLLDTLCEYIQYFGAYGFNKSHAYSYAMLTYYTAYLKQHYYLIFYKHVCSMDMKDHNKIRTYIEEYEQQGYNIVTPNALISTWDFSIKDNQLVMGMGICKSLSRSAADHVLSLMSENSIDNIYDLHLSLKKQYNTSQATSIRPMVLCGALDMLSPDRNELLCSLSCINKISDYRIKNGDSELQDFIELQMNKARSSYTYLTRKDLAFKRNESLVNTSLINTLQFDMDWIEQYKLHTLDSSNTRGGYLYIALVITDSFLPARSNRFKIRGYDAHKNKTVFDVSIDLYEKMRVRVGDTVIVKAQRTSRFINGIYYIRFVNMVFLEKFVNDRKKSILVDIQPEYIDKFLLLLKSTVESSQQKIDVYCKVKGAEKTYFLHKHVNASLYRLQTLISDYGFLSSESCESHIIPTL